MDMDIEKRTLRKITWRIVPFIMILYLIAYIDRVNIGFAAITMKEDLGFTASILGFGAGIFFLGYFLFEVPSNIILHKVGARIWIARVMVTWGIIAGGMAFVESSTSFYVMRFLLGVAEAGFFPGIILYLSYWFPARNRAGVIALFMAAAPIATAIGSPISAALLEMHGIMGLAGWQWMFLIEAIPAVILGVVVFFYMTDRPEKAAWLKPDEREWLVKTMQAEDANKGGQQQHSILRGLANPRVLALALIYFGTSAGLYTLGIWAPQIIKELGVSSMTVGLLNAIPPIISVVAMILWSRHSDKTNERTWHVALACLTAAVGLAIAASTGSMFGLIAALTIVNVGISCSKPPLWSMPTMFLSGAAAATGIATINSIGNLGGFAGPAMIGWVKDQTGSFAGGLYFVAGLLILSTVLTLVLSFTQKNKANSAELSNS
ncbi:MULTISPECIES: MFS transporter [Acinetobacter]|jgi:ACS family tartrate transporter-like MFS transporter|uniref:MFS transporter n=1 Tax=Acinetobacter TaxID=469 RepID=UPI0007B41065|nr:MULTISPECIES: MFS transporter [Acinetobacter]MCF7642707.1 MFS transporter [Acinetobacter johnsonii]MDH1800840.1 MFS transporter [Acinetobacter johnsonii]QKY89271.1 MFS transporter [Acinetobacter sp. NEB 394]